MPTLLGMMKLPIPATCDGQNLTRAMAESRDDAAESVPLFLTPLNFRGLYTRRHTYCFDTSAGTTAQYREMFFTKLKGVQWNCLYDRSTDAAETTNLFTAPDHQAVREQLHQQTLAWMRRFGDEGKPYEAVIQAVFTPEDREFRKLKKWDEFTGILKGRPSELLK